MTKLHAFLLTITIQITTSIIWNNNDNAYGNSFITPGINFGQCGTSTALNPGSSVSFTHPGYPNPYSGMTFCSWMIYSTVNDRLVMNCQVFDLALSEVCGTGAYLAVDDGIQPPRRFCGGASFPQVVTSSAYVSVSFWSGTAGGSTNEGFYCTVSPLSSGSSSSSSSSPSGVVSTSPSVTTCRCGQRGPGNRIVGGQNASLHEFPWQALVYFDDAGFCGGVLINERYVLTVAHCLLPPELPAGSLPLVVLGEHDRSTANETSLTRTIRAKRVLPHESYSKGTARDNDIGLIELEEDLPFVRSEIAPACPPDPTQSYEDVDAVITGWGLNEENVLPDILQKADVKTLSNAVCREQYSANAITDNMICAAAPGKDACLSDSGGPLITYNGFSWVLNGLSSFGPVPCGDPDRAGVYTRVGNYIPWIVSNIGDARTCLP